MAMNKEMLKEAFDDALAQEFKDLPSEEQIDHVFSPSFEDKMQTLIHRQRKKSWHLTNTARKRVILIAAILVLLMISGCSVPSIRAHFVSFYREVRESAFQYHLKGEKRDTIAQEYNLTQIPEGFERVTHISSEADSLKTEIYTVYESADHDTLELVQNIEALSVPVGGQNYDHHEVRINGMAVDIYIGTIYSQAVWTMDGYFMNLTYNGATNIAAMTEWIEQIK